MNFIEKLEEWITMKSPKLVGVLMCASILMIAVGVNIWIVKWILRMLGVL